MGDSPGQGNGVGKGDLYRPVDEEMYDLNYKLAFGKITQDEYDKKLASIQERRG